MKTKYIPTSFKINEWTGAIGDLGVFLPIFVGLVALNGLAPGKTLLIFGLTYIVTACFYRIPIPVQPLKAMGAIAIAQGLPISVLASGGFWIGVLLTILTFSGSIDKLSKIFTKPIVKGIQLGVGLMLIRTALKLVFTQNPEYNIISSPVNNIPSIPEFISSIWILVLPQLPLTLGNAVFAVSDVSKTYFPKNSSRANPKNFAATIGIFNILISFFGGLPICHGSGGLTAHYKFGARSNGTTIITGTIFILLAIIFNDNLFTILSSIPNFALGAMLLYVGVSHSQLIKEVKEKRTLVILMGVVGLLTSNLSYSLVFGIIFELIFKLKERSGISRTAI